MVGNLKNTDFITQNTFFIGVYPGLSPADLRYIASVFERFMANTQVHGLPDRRPGFGVQRFRSIRKKILPFAEAQGLLTDDDIFKVLS